MNEYGIEVGTSEQEIQSSQEMFDYCMSWNSGGFFDGQMLDDAFLHLDTLVYFISEKIKDRHCDV